MGSIIDYAPAAKDGHPQETTANLTPAAKDEKPPEATTYDQF